MTVAKKLEVHFPQGTLWRTEEADPRCPTPLQTYSACYIQRHITELVPTGFKSFTTERRCDKRTKERQPDLTAMGVPTELDVNPRTCR